MIKEAKAIGSTVEEAKDKALAALGAGANDDVQIEVISRPKKKVLGLFGGAPAQVRVYIELPDEKPRKKQNAPKRDAAKPTHAAETPAKKNAEKPTQKAQKAEKATETPAKTAPVKSGVAEDFKESVDASTLPAESPAKQAVDYLLKILAEFGCSDITAQVAERERGAFISLNGEGLGAVIGRRGETLDALQYLAGLAVNDAGGYYKVSLNFGNYREKREQTLTELAARVSEQVLRTRRNRTLEPMNPYERRIIHTAVQAIDGVTSASIGEGSGRRIVIAIEGSEIRPMRRDDRRYQGRGGRDRNRRPSNTVATTPTREPKSDSDLPLYGKIN